MVIFAVGECLRSPTLPAIINDLAPPGRAGRYNGLGTLAFTTDFLLGPVIGGAALSAGRGDPLRHPRGRLRRSRRRRPAPEPPPASRSQPRPRTSRPRQTAGRREPSTVTKPL